MNKLTIYPIAVAFFLTAWCSPAFAQFTVSINVLSGTSTTTCTDPIGAPDPQWAVNIDGAGWVVYPANAFCYTNFPNEQFNETYPCLADIPPTVQVCFRAFENDASILNLCSPVFSCPTELCIDVPVPPMGTVPFTVTLPTGGQSGGSVNMNITSTGVPGGVNDALCNAIPFGLLATGVPIGFPDTSIFNNFCATNLNEPDPGNSPNVPWFNDQGVWFSFTTGPNPTDAILVESFSDPSNFGDPINIQMAVFRSSNNACNGTFSFVAQNHSPTDFGETIPIFCPEPNTTYFVLVDGRSTTNAELEGWFGLQVTQLDVIAASELRCTAENIGTVPLGGSIGTALRTNACSMNSNASPATAFGVQKSVWFTFTPPPTGHVYLQGTSSSIDDIGLQIAVYESATGNCSNMVEVASQHTNADLDELLELSCLDPNTTYYIQVDGALNALNSGIFSLTLTDAGNETPTTSLTPIICFGESFTAGGNVYTQNGIYFDTLQLPGGCDSIVITDLTVLTELLPNIQVVNQGIGLGNTNGQMGVVPSGGAGSYSVEWSNGQTGNLASNLVGGNNYCVTVTDANGCEATDCLDMPFYVNFIPSVTGSTLDCFGDSDGTIEFSAIGGVAPYIFDWQNSDNSLSGSGQINFDGEVIVLPNLPGGMYAIHLNDVVFDTVVIVQIVEPTQLSATVTSVTNATCFMECDGEITISVAGGTPPYQANWSNGATGLTVAGLCADDFSVTILDANGCTTGLTQTVSQPPPFSLTATQAQAVSCFQGSDGRAVVTASEPVQSYLWSNGETTSFIAGVPGGNYSVTATNAAGCTASASVVVVTPNAPITINLMEMQGIICNGDETGEIQAMVSGPGNDFSFNWSNGDTDMTATGLPAGGYAVTVSNENGCTATAAGILTEPTVISATSSTNTLSCLDPADAGIIIVETVIGGNGPYTYGSNAFSFDDSSVLGGYAAGQNNYFVQDAGGCIIEFQATIPGPEVLLIDLGNDQEIDLGDSIRLEVESSQTGLTYLWSPADGLSCTDCAKPTARPRTSQTYQVVVTTPDGCTATDQVSIMVNTNQRVFVPNVFSPNGDGINDEFLPFTGGAVERINAFRVYDRQGNLVFEAKDMPQNQPGLGWNGEFRGKRMQPAVFVWTAEVAFFDGRVRVFKGDVTLVK